MATFATSTPSPQPSGIRTPPTPKHGYSDHWEPYSPRKSARISSQRATHRTPSPSSSHRTPRTTRKSTVAATAIMSPAFSPQKRRLPALDAVHRASSSRSVAHTHGHDKEEQDESRAAAFHRRSGMLPTPVKTPRKAPTETQAASIEAVARNLFVDDDALTTPLKKRTPKKYTGMSLESFTAEAVQDDIQIFTDSHDRVPEVDNSVENPFYGSNTEAQPEPRLRRSKRKVTVPGEGAQHVDEALQREDGMVYVFRGKKVFRKFADNDDGLDEEAALEAHLGRPLTRSSIKPRRLFQRTEPPEILVTPEDEEALTDIEDHHMDEEDKVEETPETPVAEDSCPATPAAPRFGPAATPPGTRRTTRFLSKSEDATPSRAKTGRTLFEDWRRVKSRPDSTERTTKRPAGDELSAATPKRTRS
ncbi:uncharacterized protein VDAG_10041 [Verticillium dahliae VdLs.17]|uniref:Uncharacterized protein n=2 Tax=Verticillium dahliae TaxID=27337 RepID=G2XIR8_VERDV|nr:uncharacterized protein VDAG_10041 [Verticillium dahliae VdLs.17]KAF3347348.1 hypothetical protein VdG2_04438 [Verticillium dahliae VDG2]KAH6662602.1 hypothetical protein EV126DRAFT_235193 [Verticillium dahliae]EGY20412.1 hypothetical protein VDAG_10041 [Verticillium dahliae VdLs.17]KAH6700779.1 hypothetical protein EV126DRAFT_249540 [Verticillium dahliae]PNH33916.1 hypothetical protein BJF96_g2970 [Verticillium dahliae]